jgi:hypothetical protein
MFTSLNTGNLGFSAPFEEALQLASSNGFSALDPSLDELLTRVQQTSVAEILERFQVAGLQSGGWGLPVDFRGSEETYQSDLAKLPQYAALAQKLGSSWCSTWILPFSDTLDYAANMHLHTRRLRPVAQILADYNCRFGLEFVGPKTMRDGHTYPFIHTISGALELGSFIDTGLLLDCWHWYSCEKHGQIRTKPTHPASHLHLRPFTKQPTGREVTLRATYHMTSERPEDTECFRFLLFPFGLTPKPCCFFHASCRFMSKDLMASLS